MKRTLLATAECPWRLRLPRFFEMRSWLQAGNGEMAIDGTAFPDMPSGWYWSQVSTGGYSQQDCFVDQGCTCCNMAGQFHMRVVPSETAASCIRHK